MEVQFDGDSWAWKALQDFVAFKDMYEYVINQSAMDSHKDSMSYFVIDPDLHKPGSDTELRDKAEASIKSSLNHFAAQTVVSLCTTFEVAIRQFFKCLFIMHPNYMHNYIGSRDNRGTVPLADLVDSGDYSKFISELAERASAAASKGKYNESLKRASKLSKYEIDTEIFENIKELQVTRNKIVHEKNLPNLELEDIQNSHSIVSSTIEELCHMGIKKQLPGRYTYVDPEITMELKSVALVKPDNA